MTPLLPTGKTLETGAVMNSTQESISLELTKLHLYFVNDIFLIDSEGGTDMQKTLFKRFNKIFHVLIHNTELSTAETEDIINTYLDSNLPYIIAINHFNTIQNELTRIYLDLGQNDTVFSLFNTYTKIKNSFGKAYLNRYLNQLRSNNQIRLIRLGELMEKNVLNYYETHIVWLNDITKALMSGNVDDVPPLCPKKCEFGKWLNSGAKAIISNNSKFSSINQLHEDLHQYAHNILNLLKSHHLKHLSCMSYLEKMEMTSLEIGTELALIDNKMMIAKASKDPLTGVLNRSLLEQIFTNQYEIAVATESKFIIAMCDLDNFKLINDTYGHVAGDLVLKSFANLLKKGLRSSDAIVRYGGEEFVIILPVSDSKLAYNILDKQRLDFQNSSVQSNNIDIYATVSIGIAEVNFIDNMSIDDIFSYYLEKADANLYHAKQEGRNRVKI